MFLFLKVYSEMFKSFLFFEINLTYKNFDDDENCNQAKREVNGPGSVSVSVQAYNISCAIQRTQIHAAKLYE